MNNLRFSDFLPHGVVEWILVILIVVVGFFGILGCQHPQPAPANSLPAAGLGHVYATEDGQVYRSPQPSAAEFAYLVSTYGIKSVVKLNSSIEGHDYLPVGVELYHHPWLPAGPVTHDEIVDALDDLDRAEKPVLVHCEHGVDRTGLLIALWRVRHGVSPDAAWGEWRHYGRDPNLFLLSEAFERETGYQPR